jgi:hypothetical protein
LLALFFRLFAAEAPVQDAEPGTVELPPGRILRLPGVTDVLQFRSRLDLDASLTTPLSASVTLQS